MEEERGVGNKKMKRDMIHEFLNRKIVAVVAAAAFVFGLSSCTAEEEINVPGQSGGDGTVQLALHIDAGSYRMPVTRTGTAGNDTGGDPYDTGRMPIVLVFELPSGETYAGDAATKAGILRENAVFKEAALATDVSAPKVKLGTTTQPVRLLIVSDPPSDLTVSALKTALAGKTFAQAVTGILNTARLSTTKIVEEVPYAGTGKYIPATGICDLDGGIDASTQIGTSGAGAGVKLQRIAAKITVVNTDAKFILQGATVLNTRQYGCLYRDFDLPAAAAEDTVHYLKGTGDARVIGIAKAVSNSTATNPLYVYESAAGEVTVLVQGKFNDNSNTSYWYRLALKDKDNGNPMAVDRNTHYILTITEVGMRGYASIDDALKGTTVAGNVMKYTVLSSGLSDHEIVDNGVYYLGLSNSEFIHWSKGKCRKDEDGNEVYEVLTTISTNAPSGTPISVKGIAGEYGNIELSPLTSSAPGGETTIDVKATFITKPEPGFIVDGNMALYTITVGVLEKQLLVVQRGTSLFVAETPTDIKGKYVAASVEEGQEWLSLVIRKGSGYGDYTTNDVTQDANGDTLRIYSNVLQMSKYDYTNINAPSDLPVEYGTIMASHTPTKDTITVVDGEKFVNTGGRVKMSIAQSKTAVHRFAKSNVVLYVDGENRILTFAEDEADFKSKTVEYQDVGGNGKRSVTFSEKKGTALKANVQGIIFRWGGLVGISTSTNPGNTGLDVYNTPFSSTDVVFWPFKYWNKGNTDWVFDHDIAWNNNRQVPFFGFNEYMGIDDMNFDAFDEKYPGKGYDDVGGYGDICRYISDQGWVKGDWRLPTGQEFKILRVETQMLQSGIDYGKGNSSEPMYGVLYGHVNVQPFTDTGDRLDWVPCAVTNPNPAGHYGFTHMPNARMAGAGVTSNDNVDRANPYNKYLTDPVGARVVVPAAGSNTIVEHKGSLYFPGGNGYFMSSTPSRGAVRCLHVNAANSPGLYITNYFYTNFTRDKTSFSVRCIRKWPDE